MNATSSSWQILTKTSLAETLLRLRRPCRLARDADDLAEGLLLDAREERLDDAELDVGLEEREAHLAQRGLDVLLGQLGQAGEAVAGGLETLGEGVEHGAPDLAQREAALISGGAHGGDRPSRGARCSAAGGAPRSAGLAGRSSCGVRAGRDLPHPAPALRAPLDGLGSLGRARDGGRKGAITS